MGKGSGQAALPGGSFQPGQRSGQLGLGHPDLQAEEAGSGRAVFAAQIGLHAGGQEELLQLRLSQTQAAEIGPEQGARPVAEHLDRGQTAGEAIPDQRLVLAREGHPLPSSV